MKVAGYDLTAYLGYRPKITSRIKCVTDGKSTIYKIWDEEIIFDNSVNIIDQYISLFAHMESKYELINGVVKRRQALQSFDEVKYSMLFQLTNPPNWIHIPPKFSVKGVMNSVKMHQPSIYVKNAFEVADLRVSRVLYRRYDRQPKLLELPTYRTFGSNEFGTFVRQAKMDITTQKTLNSYLKYGKDVKDWKMPHYVSRCVMEGYTDFMIALGKIGAQYAINCEITDEMIDLIPDINSSSGLRAGSHETITGELPTKFVVNGKKIDTGCYAKKQLKYIIGLLRDHRYNEVKRELDTAWKIELKDEHYRKICETQEEYDKFKDKVRDFFIPSHLMYLMSYITQKDRQMFERGDIIKIGHKWFGGGAQRIADFLKVNDDDAVFCDADFDGLDTTLSRTLLEMYCMSSLYYYSPSSPDYELFANLLKICTANLTCKPTYMGSDIWRYIVGSMPSGAFQTSHGDSWCVALMFFTFIRYQISTNPHLKGKIEQALKDGKIMIIVYGDDLIYRIPRAFLSVLGISKWKIFLDKYTAMRLRDVREDIPFFSVPNEQGELDVTGVVFLKRYFIKTPRNLVMKHKLATVLPYRPTSSVDFKIAYGASANRHSAVCEMISMIGMAYDTMGTNPRTYELCEDIFDNVSAQLGEIDLGKALQEMDARYITRIIRKYSVQWDDLAKGFPSQEKLMMLHKFGPESKVFHEVRQYTSAEYVLD